MNEAVVTVSEKVPMVQITREFDAPVAKLFRAHIDPALFVKWNWTEGYTVEFDQWDCHTGGAYRITMSGPEMAGTVHGSFHDVISDKMLVQTFTPDSVPDLVVLERHRFEDLGNGRSRIVSTSLVESFEYRDVFLDAGLVEGFARLEELLKSV